MFSADDAALIFGGLLLRSCCSVASCGPRLTPTKAVGSLPFFFALLLLAPSIAWAQSAPLDAPQATLAQQPAEAAALPDAPAPQPAVAALSTLPPVFPSTASPLAADSPWKPSSSSAPNSAGLAEPEARDPFSPAPFGTTAVPGERIPLTQCPYDQTHARECRVHWHDLILSAAAYDAFQDVGNLYSGFTYRFQTTHGKWFDRWINSAAGWRWSRWADGNPFLDDYVGHSMMGAITNYIWIEHDPKGMTVLQGNTPEYWHSLERAFIFSTAFSFEWKLGPFGEASVGHNGDYYQYENGNIETPTNETGWVELVTTPVGGVLWSMGEDALDQRVLAKWEQKHNNPFTLVAFSLMTPAHSVANIMRFRPLWYRDTRSVHASGLFEKHDPEFTSSEPPPYVRATTRPVHTGLPHRFGGNYEIGTLIGVSLTHDSKFGSDENNKYMDILLRGSARIAGNDRVAVRYSPEFIAMAMLDEPLVYNPNTPKLNRTRTYGTGFSPEGFQLVFRPTSRIQPFFDQHLGAIGFFKPVLLATRPGNNAIYNVNFGAGMNIVRVNGNAVSFGYRFQHMAAFNGPQANATDAHTFYIAISHFFQHHHEVF